ncbi:hypothetical protein B0H13DRAFT_1891445 [Mycena leptocephala]|nr:hypothetical protein B0H13DRAFT_1891445 [Mycena leptocephala]
MGKWKNNANEYTAGQKGTEKQHSYCMTGERENGSARVRMERGKRPERASTSKVQPLRTEQDGDGKGSTNTMEHEHRARRIAAFHPGDPNSRRGLFVGAILNDLHPPPIHLTKPAPSLLTLAHDDDMRAGLILPAPQGRRRLSRTTLYSPARAIPDKMKNIVSMARAGGMIREVYTTRSRRAAAERAGSAHRSPPTAKDPKEKKRPTRWLYIAGMHRMRVKSLFRILAPRRSGSACGQSEKGEVRSGVGFSGFHGKSVQNWSEKTNKTLEA